MSGYQHTAAMPLQDQLLPLNVTPLSLGMAARNETDDLVMFTLHHKLNPPRGTTNPTTKKRVFPTRSDNQTSALFKVRHCARLAGFFLTLKVVCSLAHCAGSALFVGVCAGV